MNPVRELPLPDSPYRGIESYRLIDHPIFCARRQETRKLIRAITIYRGVLVYGASTAGKSSLINAGLLPEAIAEGFAPERIRIQPRPGQEIIVERISVTEGAPPCYLSSIFAPDDDTEPRVVLAADEMKSRLPADANTPIPLLIFDQFEELVTLFEEVPQTSSAEAKQAQDSILTAIVDLLRDPRARVKLLFSFREEYFTRLNRLFSKVPDLTDHFLRVTPPDEKALPEILRGPFENEVLRQHFGRELPPEVLTDLQAEIEKRSAGGPLNLSEIQIVCLRLWKSADPAELLNRRHIQGLLEDYLTEALERLKRLRDPAVAILSRMVTPRGTRNVVEEDELIQSVKRDEHISVDVIRQALASLEKNAHLIRREIRNETYFYEIVSEFLIPWIRGQKQERAATKERQRLRRRVYGAASAILLGGLAAIGWNLSSNTTRKLRATIEEKDTEIRSLKDEASATKAKLAQDQESLARAQASLGQQRASLQQLWMSQKAILQDRNIKLQKAVQENAITKTALARCGTEASSWKTKLAETTQLLGPLQATAGDCAANVTIARNETLACRTAAKAALTDKATKIQALQAEVEQRDVASRNACTSCGHSNTLRHMIHKIEDDQEDVAHDLRRVSKALEANSRLKGSLDRAVDRQHSTGVQLSKLKKLLSL